MLVMAGDGRGLSCARPFSHKRVASSMQFAFNTLERVSPVSHGVCNVVKRIAIIFSSVIFFNQVRG